MGVPAEDPEICMNAMLRVRRWRRLEIESLERRVEAMESEL
ncbi:MAG: hypothetical protein OXR73_14620 [Myxococcales bacterium]|nr:hypothetical protein [Myxococcales bacterium]